ncbi:NAD(P)-binding protein [Lentinula aciculospora]|uniref:NAD(P)-binding protein n=1 Tax=Lentinula aciculospora TaxID=153920 RepID=A0A9W9DJ27_9AGAR|nr:NAD(P)-binding protein [Lentinula aciculospora]
MSFKLSPSALAVSLLSITLTTYLFKSHRRASRLTSIQALNAKDFPSYSSDSLPVAVFIGGTAGIGRGMAEAFARYTHGNAHIILIGRNAITAQLIISSFPKPTSPLAKHEFVRCDATLMSESQRTIDELLARLPKINYLVISTMLLKNFHREETMEGKEPKLVLMYYARFKFMRELSPLLRKAKEDAGEDAKVFIVGGAGLGKTIDYEDLGLQKNGYSFWKVRKQLPVYLDVILQEFAARNPSTTFIHAYPGPVRSALADNLEWPLFIFIFKIVFELSFPFTHSESGEYIVHGMLTTLKRPGVWSLNMWGEKISEGKIVVAKEEERKLLWEHSLKETVALPTEVS